MHPNKLTEQREQRLVDLDTRQSVWERFFWVAPLVLIGTREPDGSHDLAPKHMAFPLGWNNYFGFVCTPRHATYRNIHREGVFTVSYPRPDQLVQASLAAAPRSGEGQKPSLSALPVFPARSVDGILVKDACAFLECELYRFVDGFGENSLIAGEVIDARIDAASERQADRDEQQLIWQDPLLAYLHPGRCAEIRESRSFPFPAGMKK